MLGVVASMLAVVCKRMQQLPTRLGPAVYRGKDTSQQCWTSSATDPTFFRHSSAIMEQKKCWEFLAQKVNRFQNLRNNS